MGRLSRSRRGGVIAEPSTGATGAVVGAQVSVVGISKRFGATQALDAVSVEIEAGTIHALVGENGAGKSTLGKIIGGVYVADSGVLRVDGHDVGRWNPPAALAAGIATIQQELSLVPAPLGRRERVPRHRAFDASACCAARCSTATASSTNVSASACPATCRCRRCASPTSRRSRSCAPSPATPA